MVWRDSIEGTEYWNGHAKPSLITPISFLYKILRKISLKKLILFRGDIHEFLGEFISLEIPLILSSYSAE